MPDFHPTLIPTVRSLVRAARGVAAPTDFKTVRKAMEMLGGLTDPFGFPLTERRLVAAQALCERVAPDRNMLLALLLQDMPPEQLAEGGDDVKKMVKGLHRAAQLYEKGVSVAGQENFGRLLMAFAEDIRVIIIMIVDRYTLMRLINHHPDEQRVRETAMEAAYLYAPLAHRLGLYAIKGDLEDMWLKYTDREAYSEIAHGLNARKAERDAYISAFIAPVKAQLEKAGLNFSIKGRTKSIYSIWNKIKKQKNDLDHIYDLFAIRIIIDTAPEKEKADCWTAYSVVTDMYRPNPSRMKDWISIPKSNGYESLHITVAGPEGKWVEVQIRTRRMDLVAEKGLAAHWRYKGVKSEGELDAWMNNVRDILETASSGPSELMRNLRMDVYDKEVFCFTPKGDLYRFQAGASLLDFAFAVHTRLGCTCTGGRVNGKNQRLGYRLQMGDTVEILTSSQQQPKQDWLNLVVTSKARTKIRQTLKERAGSASDLGRELIQRRFKNRKIELDEATLNRLVKKLGYKNLTDFFVAVADGVVAPESVIERYLTFEAPPIQEGGPARSAAEFTLAEQKPQEGNAPGAAGSSEVLVIGSGIKGLDYRLARCCNPICGDDVFGFISSDGTVKVHRNDCPNAAHIRQRYPYRVISTRWAAVSDGEFSATLRVVGHDDIGIVTNITSIIQKHQGAVLRSISIDSHDGLFQGHLTVGVSDNRVLGALVKKIHAVKGVKEATRS